LIMALCPTIALRPAIAVWRFGDQSPRGVAASRFAKLMRRRLARAGQFEVLSIR